MFFKNSRKDIGVDVVEVSRFETFSQNKSSNFLQKVFTSYELDYCFQYKDVAPHLAGIFAAKEAVSKALGAKRYPFIEIEIRHRKDGKPVAYQHMKVLPISISIAHTSSVSIAVAMA